MPDSTAFLCGIIEGFYGRMWAMETRFAYAGYLRDAGLNTCIYCPKGDDYLRRNWRRDWPEAAWNHLLELAGAYARAGVYWGVGLSPVELYREYGTKQREALRRKVERLGLLSAPLIAVLFDDMPGALDALAERQAEIVADIRDWMPGVRVLACPTYYSHDPVLEQYFGEMPVGYWTQLGALLPADVDIFWTGERVCSEVIDAAHLRSITGQLGRPVTLWDNYPVNDGAVRCEFLYTEKLAGRDADIRPYLRGHLCNPMNQGLLSLPALAGLSELYGTGGLGEAVLARALGPATWEKLSRDRRLFQREGRANMDEGRRRQLVREYGQLPGPAAREIAGWLRGEYAFDPACLTG